MVTSTLWDSGIENHLFSKDNTVKTEDEWLASDTARALERSAM